MNCIKREQTKRVVEWQELTKNKKEIIIELGCGENKQFGDIGIDIITTSSTDFVIDLEDGLYFISDNSVDIIYSRHFLEHIENLQFLISEIVRVLKPGGKKIGWVPHWSNPYFYSDPTHKTPFGLYTFCYFCNRCHYKRKVPMHYQNNEKLILSKNYLLLNNQGIVAKVIMKIINTRYMQEFFERYLAKCFFVDEIYFHLTKIDK